MTIPDAMTSPLDLEQVLAELPEDGSEIVADVAIARAGLSVHRGWGALCQLITDHRATSRRYGGATWAKRTPVESTVALPFEVETRRTR